MRGTPSSLFCLITCPYGLTTNIITLIDDGGCFRFMNNHRFGELVFVGRVWGYLVWGWGWIDFCSTRRLYEARGPTLG